MRTATKPITITQGQLIQRKLRFSVQPMHKHMEYIETLGILLLRSQCDKRDFDDSSVNVKHRDGREMPPPAVCQLSLCHVTPLLPNVPFGSVHTMRPRLTSSRKFTVAVRGPLSPLLAARLRGGGSTCFVFQTHVVL